MNPYDFVRLDITRPPVRIEPSWHNRFEGSSGVIHCLLTTETPIFVADQARKNPESISMGTHNHLKFFCAQGKPTIPGSSLKGVFRSVAEAAANSCMVLCDGMYEQRKIDYTRQIPGDFLSCSDNRRLCVTCRLFGMLKKSAVYLGKVNISDASPLHTETLKEMTLVSLMTPKPRHRAFYLPDGKLAGRKFYFHSKTPLTSAQKTKYNTSTQPVQGEFRFTVSYENLLPEEISLLVYSLVLEPGMRHKIGMGKSAGLGSVRITITKVDQIDRKERYGGAGSGVTHIEGDELERFVASMVKPFVDDKNSVNLMDLRRILAWPPKHAIQYPSKQWFGEHSQERIAQTP